MNRLTHNKYELSIFQKKEIPIKELSVSTNSTLLYALLIVFYFVIRQKTEKVS